MSYQRAQNACSLGLFKDEIILIDVMQKGKPVKTVNSDDEIPNVNKLKDEFITLNLNTTFNRLFIVERIETKEHKTSVSN